MKLEFLKFKPLEKMKNSYYDFEQKRFYDIFIFSKFFIFNKFKKFEETITFFFIEHIQVEILNLNQNKSLIDFLFTYLVEWTLDSNFDTNGIVPSMLKFCLRRTSAGKLTLQTASTFIL